MKRFTEMIIILLLCVTWVAIASDKVVIENVGRSFLEDRKLFQADPLPDDNCFIKIVTFMKLPPDEISEAIYPYHTETIDECKLEALDLLPNRASKYILRKEAVFEYKGYPLTSY